ncbi:helix-turn-helix transcriptional regulator [Actinomadura sp. NEAU-AAG7]|uniref:helix-turn-helix domain-containing protein n=1 Tax=Actinomadura sp. NEAU-AAG7 TaxID=2839640 RepID=UPI001BE49737|nr:helix-turn-helix transcriptional regulator [Actinomadura sp. NEAU-AAG7]MBT2209542.1 hypothetical protein [Actinomadura sp. NEAU-AAG7]
MSVFVVFGDDGLVMGTRDLLGEGRGLLRRGAWGAAREVFERALADGAAEGAAAEGIAAASWWLDDDAEMTARYEQAYRCHRASGDDRSAARAAVWLGNGAVQFRGETAVAQGWFRRAGRLLAGVPEGEEHGLLALFEGMAARAGGELVPALDLAERAAAIGRRLGSADLEIQGMALAGVVRVSQGLTGEGMALLDEAAAAALAGEVSEAASVWIPSCYLVQGCEWTRDWERAEQWCGRVMDFCRRLDLGSPFSQCRTHYSAVLLWRGDWAEAEDQLLRAAGRVGDRPLVAAQVWARLGELRRRQGRWDEADALFAREPAVPAARVGRAELLVDRGDPLAAVETARMVLDGMAPDDRLERVPVLEVLVRASAAAGLVDALAGPVEELAGIGGGALAASALWARGVACGALGDPAGATPPLARAVALFERTRGPYDAARARLDLAAVLRAAGRDAAAAREARAALGAFVRLGAAADAGRARTLAGEPGPPAGLTARQAEVLALVADGLTNAQIAERFVLSPHTVKRHVADILARLGLPSRAAAAAYAARPYGPDGPYGAEGWAVRAKPREARRS